MATIQHTRLVSVPILTLFGELGFGHDVSYSVIRYIHLITAGRLTNIVTG